MGCVSLVNSHARGLPSYDAMGRPLPRGSMPRIIDGHPPANAARFCVSQIVGLQGCLAACPARAPPPPSPPPQGSPAHQCLESLAIQPDLAKDGRIVDMGGHGTVARSLATGRRPAAAAALPPPPDSVILKTCMKPQFRLYSDSSGHMKLPQGICAEMNRFLQRKGSWPPPADAPRSRKPSTACYCTPRLSSVRRRQQHCNGTTTALER